MDEAYRLGKNFKQSEDNARKYDQETFNQIKYLNS